MSGRNRKFRRRAEDEQDNEEPESLGMPPASVIAARKAKEKEKKAGKKPSLLSFEEEEGASPTTAKSESRAKEKSKMKIKPNLKNLSIADEGKPVHRTQQSAAGEYSAERLQAMKANAKSFTGTRAPMSTVHTTSDEGNGGAFKLSGSFKPASQKSAPAPQEAAVASGEAELPPPARPKVTIAGGTVAATPPEDEEDGFHVPSAEMIRLAKQKRERLRSAHLAPDYVPLGGAAGLASLEARLKPEGAPPAAQDASDSDEEGRDQRLAFVGEPRLGILEAVPQEPEIRGRDEEDDDDDWVREQIRKGVGGGPPPGRPTAAAAAAETARRPPPSWTGLGDSAAYSGEAALKSLQQSLSRLKATQVNIDKQAARTQENMRGSFESVARLQTELAAAGDKYTYLQQLRTYIADLCDMLQAKAAVVEELEEHLMEAAEQRASAAAQRSIADEAAELEPASAAISAALGVLSRGGDLPAASEAAAAAAADAERSQNGGGAVELDEFGRDVRVEASREATQRQQRLEKRMHRWQLDAEAAGADTSEESEGESRQYSRRRKEVLDTAASVFADADEEFATLASVKRRLEAWRKAQPGAFASAYAGDNAPAIFAPFVRNELLGWEPVFPGTGEFDEQRWYQELLDFGHGSADGDDLIPSLVGNLVMPLALHAVRMCWNPFSRSQTRRIVKLMDHLLVFLTVEEPKVQELTGEIQRRLEAAAAQLKLPPWPQAATAAAPRAAAVLAHRFGKALRLVANVAAFDSLLPRLPLLAIVFDRLLQQQLIPYVVGASELEAAVSRCGRLVDALPSAWIKGQPQRAKPLVDALTRFARTLESRRTDGGRPDKAHVRRLAQALTKAGEAGTAKNLMQAYGL